jgi:hypothetical protein
MDEHDFRMEMAGDAEGEDNTDPDAQDAQGCFQMETDVPEAILVARASYPGKALERCSCGALKPVGEPHHGAR